MTDSKEKTGRTAPSALRAAGARRSSDRRRPARTVIPYAAGPTPEELEPIVALQVTGPNGKTIIDSALLDTGADTSAFPLHWMRRLGIRKKDCSAQEFLTAGGCARQWSYEPGLEAVVLERCFRLYAVFVDTPVALLGRDDFMSEFELWFDHRGSRFSLRPY
jgi:hypothetical protein